MTKRGKSKLAGRKNFLKQREGQRRKMIRDGRIDAGGSKGNPVSRGQ